MRELEQIDVFVKQLPRTCTLTISNCEIGRLAGRTYDHQPDHNTVNDAVDEQSASSLWLLQETKVKIKIQDEGDPYWQNYGL